MRKSALRIISAGMLVTACCLQASAATVCISNLKDVSFTTVDPTVQASSSQSNCVFSNTATRGYGVTATGSGAASAFTLSGGGSVAPLPYTVEWSDVAGSSTGTALVAGVQLTGLTSSATRTRCRSGPANSSSLIIILQPTDLEAALSGIAYTGVLTLVIAPE